MSTKEKALIDLEIVEELRTKLNKEIEKQNGDLSHPEVQKISCELDKFIILEMMEPQKV